MNKPIDELSLCKSCNCMTKTMNTSIKTYCGKCGADKPITEEQVALHYRIFVKVMSSICESNPKIQSGKPCIRGTRFTLNEIEGAVKDLIELSRNQVLKEVLELVEDEELKPYKGEYTKEIQQDRLNIVKRNELRQKLRASIKKLMEVL